MLRLCHAFKKFRCFTGIIPGLCHKDDADMIRLRFLSPVEWEGYPHGCCNPIADIGSLNGLGAFARYGDVEPFLAELQEEILADPLASMAGQRVADLMPEDECQPCLILGIGEDAGINGDFPTGEGECIYGLGIIDHGELPVICWLIRHCCYAGTHPFDHGIYLGVL